MNSERNDVGLRLEKFDFAYFASSSPPCSSLHCQLVWSSAAAALGDYGEYARRMNVPGMKEYARSLGITQDLEQLPLLQGLPKIGFSIPGSRLRIPFINIAELSHLNSTGIDSDEDLRPAIKLDIGNEEYPVTLDSGADFSVGNQGRIVKVARPVEIQAAFTRTSLNGMAPLDLATFDRVSIGGLQFNNLVVSIPARGSSTEEDRTGRGLIGFPLLFRFPVAVVNTKEGFLELGSIGITEKFECRPMKLVLNKNGLVTGIGIELSINGNKFRTRVDTGANLDALLHGNLLPGISTFNVDGKWLIDGSGKLEPVKFGTIMTDFFGKEPHTAIISDTVSPDFDMSIGIRFFRGRTFAFDFKRARFCIEARN